MNKKKRTLTLVATIFNLLTAVIYIAGLFVVIFAFNDIITAVLPEITSGEIAYYQAEAIVGLSIEIALNLSAGICLVLYLTKGQKNYKLGRKLFIAGLIINVLSELISIPTILLFIANYFYLDIEVIREERSDEVEVVDENEVAVKIAKLRKLRDDGKITEEEFQQEILKLL